jgi:hypothetical protein
VTRVIAREDASIDGASVRQLTRASTTRARLPYPKEGKHLFTPTNSECRAIRRACRKGGTNPTALVRAAALRAAGVADVARVHAGTPSSRCNGRVGFRLTREERAAIDAARGERDLSAWLRDAVRTAAGMGQHPWSPCADAALAKNFRRFGLDVLLLMLPGRDAGKVYDRARRLGLECSLTDDRLTLSEAEKVSGYSNRGLAALLREADVKVHTLAGRYADGQRRHRFVLRSELLRAVRERGTKETVHQGAARLGLYAPAIVRALRAMGHTRPAGVRYWFVPSALIDAAARSLREDIAA